MLIAQSDGRYLVSYTRTWTNDHAVVTAASSIVTRTGTAPNYDYRVGSKYIRDLGTMPSTSFIDNDEYLKTLTPDQLNNLMNEEQQYIAMLNDRFGNGNWQVIYRLDTTSKNWVPTFYNKDDLDGAIYSATGNSQSFIQAYTVGTMTERDEVKGVIGDLEKDSSGRYINITLYDNNGNGITYALTTNTSTDQQAYEAAMNQYEFDKAQYDKSIQDINNKIEIIQAEDRTLELRLKQLDTERNAIQTEIEAVSKVIEKNVQDTFKTFNA